MELLADEPRVKYAVPMEYEPLASFSCGDTYPWERELNGMFRSLARGRSPDIVAVRVAEDKETGAFIGAGCYLPLPLTLMPGPDIEDAACIPALGISEEFRGRRMPDETRIGAFLIADILAEIKLAWDDEMPPVWAIVAKGNTPCHEVVEAHGFGIVEATEGDYDLWFRQRGLDPAWWLS
ncbi:MAG TPA: hypothetical protein VIH71_17580 [Solirubrobacteraceae bacterium]